MALQSKQTVATDKFVPSRPPGIQDHKLRKSERWDNFKEWLPSIKWAKLNEEQFQAQWGNCLNAMYVLENDGAVTLLDLWPVFNRYLRLKGYTEAEKKALRDAPEHTINFSIVSKAYMLMTGNVDNKFCIKTDSWITKQLRAYLAKAPPPVDPDDNPTTRRSRDERKRDKCSEIMGDLYALEDEQGEVDVQAFFVERNVPKDYLQAIEERFRPRMHELQAAIKTKDEQLIEAYACYSKQELRAMVLWYEQLLQAVDTYRGTKVVERAPRVRKPKPPEKVVARLKYLQRSEPFNIDSVASKKLVGCNTVYLYNTKTRKLIVYHALADHTITVKGSYLMNWDPKTSFQKTLRWPEEQLLEFTKTVGKVALRNFINGIRTKPSGLRGGVGIDTLILKVM
jgi:hypothetical protein